MKTCPWEKINAFQSLSEFNRFVEWMTDETKTGNAEELSVQKPYLGGNTFREKWFRHIGSGKIWRVVWPDAAFKGFFELVD